ncbi:Aspartate aminotransferase [Hartmannibacter diazotrophicus]|uniref:Aminotransferase n=1 Tax=Hartmannibacter diazotrophicus TaxID=1482074 RepID=A0A2C9D5I6_9HYPH|nr:aminotransferase [Hartmannibacter diazotrophicus]SON55460.1 Aspartate aminotransferase [Hartmannibacter diazotrophicus]
MDLRSEDGTGIVNPRVLATDAPPIPASQAWLAAYDGGLGPIINLSQAVPSDPPPKLLLDRLEREAARPVTATYGPITGNEDLRRALVGEVSDIYRADPSSRPDVTDAAITAGCNQAFFASIIALAGAGDEVILPAPWYFNHKMTLDMLGIVAVPLPCHAGNGFVPEVEAARELVSERTRAIVLVTPNNPTGAIYPAETIEAFRTLCTETGIALVIDETYRDFLPSGHGAPHRLFETADWRRNVIQLYSFSKAFGIPGHRLGALVADRQFVQQVAKVLDCIQICPPRAAQFAVAGCMADLKTTRAENRDRIAARAQVFSDIMAGVNDWTVSSIGAYFAFVRHPFDLPAEQVAAALATQTGLLCLPGSWFGPGQEDHLRFAFANVDDAQLQGVPQRLAALRL